MRERGEREREREVRSGKEQNLKHINRHMDEK